MTRIRTVVAALALALVAAGCGGTTPATTTPSSVPPSSSAPKVSGTITVLAAASLTDTFTEIGKAFEAANPGTSVKISFGGSSALATQVVNGAPADVLAFAAESNMEPVSKANLAKAVTIFATNKLTVVTPASNPAGLSTWKDIAKPGIKLALCQEQVPCGQVTKQVTRKAGITVSPVTLEPDVRSVLTKVRLGEADAGTVYTTDAAVAGSAVKLIEIPDADNVITRYPITVVTSAPNAAGAEAFKAYVLKEGAAVLTKAGFGRP